MDIRLEKKTAIGNDGQYLIKNGRILDESLLQTPPISVPFLEMLYSEYKHSVPDFSSSERQNSMYFRALDVPALSDDDLKTNRDRRSAADALELTVLLAFLRGDIPYDRKKWFWQSKEDPEFIILRKWVI